MKSRLSIGIIGTRGIPNQYGGYEAAVEELAPRLVKKGHEVVVYCSSLQNTRITDFKGVKLVYCYDPENRLGSFGQFIYDLKCNVSSKKYKHDVIFHMGYTSDSLWYWLWDSNAVHITNMDGMEWLRSKYSNKVRQFLKKAEYLAATKSDMLIADSQGVMEYLQSNYNVPIKHIPYGVEIPQRFNINALIEYQLKENQYDLIIARIVPENNIELSIEAKLNSSNEYPLVIFGNENKYWRELQARYRNEPRIRIMASNYDRDIMDSLRYYSRYYIHGHSVGGTNPSLLEAMAAQCKITAHNNVFNRGVLKDGGFYFNSSESLTKLLDKNPDIGEFENKIEENLNRINRVYNWDTICDQYEKAAFKI